MTNTKPINEDNTEQPPIDRLENFHISFFSIVMGLTGFTLVWENIAGVTDALHIIPQILAWFTFTVFLVILGTYITKIIKTP